jgi:hypothetical protein
MQLLKACVLVVVLAATSLAQSGSVQEGALELVLPTGARAVGMGQAAVASAKGLEATFWNPALIAHASREAGFLISPPPIGGQGDAIASAVIPIRYVGAFSITARYINFGEQDATDSVGQIGTFTPVSYVLSASFAAPFGDHLSFGFTYKILRQSFNCTGDCLLPQLNPSTLAMDFGGQYQWSRGWGWPFSVGASLRNVGIPLQVRDAPQADPLPSRLDVGVAVEPTLSQLPPDASLKLSADVVSRVRSAGGSPGLRGGAELSWQGRYYARGGYMLNPPTGDSGPFAFGFGVIAGKAQLDIARMVGGTTSDANHFFLSLRASF